MVVSAAALGASGYHLIKTIRIGGDGSWDHVTLDSAARRLYIARATHVLVFDVGQNKLIGEIPDTPGVHGVALAPEFNRGFTSNGHADTVTIFDLKTLKTLSHVKTGTDPDGIAYDPVSGRVFTLNGDSSDLTAIDASRGVALQTVALGGSPEAEIADGAGKLFVTLFDKNQLVTFDTRKLAVTSRWELPSCNEPSPLAMDQRNRRLFIGCRNQRMQLSMRIMAVF